MDFDFASLSFLFCVLLEIFSAIFIFTDEAVTQMDHLGHSYLVVEFHPSIFTMVVTSNVSEVYCCVSFLVSFSRKLERWRQQPQ